MIAWMDITPSPIALRDLLKAHRMLPDIMADPIMLIRFANMTKVGYVGSDQDPSVVFLETFLEPDSRLVQVVLKDKELGGKDDIEDIALDLHARWFQELGLRRIEARIEAVRTSTIKLLKAVGFHQETAPSGIRGAYSVDGDFMNIHVLGLLPGDKPRLKLNRYKAGSTIKTEEVGHAV